MTRNDDTPIDITIDNIYEDISDLAKLDECTLAESVCKTVEEFGELTQAINKLIGRKHTSDSLDMIKINATEELADTIQNLLHIAIKLDIPLSNLLYTINTKNAKWKQVIPIRKAHMSFNHNSFITKYRSIS